MQEERGLKSGDIGVNSSEFLEEGQNFYDQPPFNPTIKDVSNKYGFSEEQLRTMLTFVVNRINRSEGGYYLAGISQSASFQEEVKARINSLALHNDLNGKMSKMGIRGERQEQFKTAVSQLTGILHESNLLWYGYIATQLLDNSNYLPNGEYQKVEKEKIKALPKTYKSWINKIVERWKVSRMHGIGEIFPELPFLKTPNIKPGYWNELKAAGIVRKK